MSERQIRLMVNGNEEILSVPDHLSLLRLLRDKLALTGTKNGCEAGECGACTVLLDGEPVNSCLVLAVECEGHRVDTIEGLSAEPVMQRLQQEFIDLNAIQCGFCTPGMLISAYALLLRNPHADDHAIREALLGNLCRCTGYERIITAVKTAAGKDR